ncbi:superoxide dismutase family protein [Noviherbaspirillum cavernae]|uniref:Superoxide dismutase [Cu-Zn] n=1 Tax=Noviherbaspirillum cavernae TaxID=2320862 RepID=A0A418X2B6_9BURK|nr:superoxide dismutase family protein [Noviherbaspirillum cavernae]RJG06588.1 superoxide dismutase family protein [Noviherbaspirillum cavernae]
MKLFLALLGTAILAGCQSSPTQPAGKQARANLEAKSGSNVAGTVDFAERGDKVVVSTKVTGLKPNADHGFHVHEKGDCSSADAMTAGGHFNPDAKPHSHPKDPMHHAGDMGNLVSDGKGEAVVSIEVDTIRVDNGKFGILDRAVVIHASPDDYKTQPTGNAGGRIACGVIKKV